MHVNECFAYVRVCTMYMTGGHRGQKKALDSLGSRVIATCGLPCGCWELKLGPVEDQRVLFNC